MIIKLEIRDNKRIIEIDTGNEWKMSDTDIKILKEAVEQVKNLLIINSTI